MDYRERLRQSCLEEVSMLPTCFHTIAPLLSRWINRDHEDSVYEWVLEQAGLFKALTHVIKELRLQGFGGGFKQLDQIPESFWFYHLDNYIQIQVEAESRKRQVAYAHEPHPLVYPNGDVQLELF